MATLAKPGRESESTGCSNFCASKQTGDRPVPGFCKGVAGEAGVKPALIDLLPKNQHVLEWSWVKIQTKR